MEAMEMAGQMSAEKQRQCPLKQPKTSLGPADVRWGGRVESRAFWCSGRGDPIMANNA